MKYILFILLSLSCDAFAAEASDLVKTEEIIKQAKALLAEKEGIDTEDLMPGLLTTRSGLGTQEKKILQIEVNFILLSSKKPLPKELKEKLHKDNDAFSKYKNVYQFKDYNIIFNAYQPKETLLIKEGSGIGYE